MEETFGMKEMSIELRLTAQKLFLKKYKVNKFEKYQRRDIIRKKKINFHTIYVFVN